jgi:hypothetical protein
MGANVNAKFNQKDTTFANTFPNHFGLLSDSLFFLSGIFGARWHSASMTEQRNNPTGRERQEKSGAKSNSAATIFYGVSVRPCILSSLTNGGARITGVKAHTFPVEFVLRVAPHGRIHKCQLLWRTDDALGVRLVERDIGTATPIEVSTARQPPPC